VENSVHLDLPVVLVGKRDPLEVALEVLLVVAAEGELTTDNSARILSKVEGEHGVLDKTLVEKVVPDRSGVVNGDGVEGKTHDSVKLAKVEGDAVLLGDLTKVLRLDLQIAKSNGILRDEAVDATAAIENIKGCAIGNIGAALGAVVTVVMLAGKLLAVDAREPEVGAASIKDNLELLLRSTSRNRAIELSLCIVSQRNVRATTHTEHALETLLMTLVKRGPADLAGNGNLNRSCKGRKNKSKENNSKTHIE